MKHNILRFALLCLSVGVFVACASAPSGAANVSSTAAVSAAVTAASAEPTADVATPSSEAAATTTAFTTVDAATLNTRLGRGVNMGNMLEAPSEGEWGLRLEEDYIQLAHDAGFTSIRVPIRWSAHAAAEAPYTVDPAFFERIDAVIDQALARDLVVVINMHHYAELMQEPTDHRDRFLAIWDQIARRYQGYPAELLFEPFNEPNNIAPSAWNKLLEAAISTIRASNPARAIVVGPIGYYAIGELERLRLPDDPQLIVTIHFYSPFQFTHQGAEWQAGSDAWLGTTWEATGNQRSEVTWDFDRAAAWAERNQRPLYLGEFGAYSKADMDSRAAWTAFVAREAEKRGMSWAYWEFGSGFGVYDPAAKTWREPLRAALLPAA